MIESKNRGRGRPRKYPTWTDPATGQVKALSAHPNYDVCRNFLARSFITDEELDEYAASHGGRVPIRRSGGDSAYRLVSEWQASIATFVYGVAADVGMRPGPYFELRPNDAEHPIGPGNVKWVHPGWAKTRRAQHAKRRRAERVIVLPTGAHVLGVFVDSLAHKDDCESSHLAPLVCPCCSAEVEAAQVW